MTYWRLHYHLVWPTKDREPCITPEREKIFNNILHKKCDQMGVILHAAGNVDDHVHVVVSIPPKMAVAEAVRHIKGATAYAINHAEGTRGEFTWQVGYAALSFGDESMEKIMAYAHAQKIHHAQNTIQADYEIMDVGPEHME